jgi:hypothetical protein
MYVQTWGVLGWPQEKVHKMKVVELHWPSFAPRFLFRCRACPLCTSVEFVAAELGPLDRLLQSFRLTPLRCVNCFRRYYCFAAPRVGR